MILASGSAADILPSGIPEHEFIYDNWDRKAVLRPDEFDYQIGPYSPDSIRFESSVFTELYDNSTERIVLFGSVRENFRSSTRRRAEAYEFLRAGLTGRINKALTFYGSFCLDEEKANDPEYRGKKWRGLAGDVDQAFVEFQSDRFNLLAGRFASFWGIRNSLILSRFRPLDGLGYRLRLGGLVISYRIAQLNRLENETDPAGPDENRYFAAHRVDYHFGSTLRFGLFETMLFGGAGRQIDLYYLNPLIFFHGSQLNEGTNDNSAVGFDFSYRPKPGLELYGQLLVDDWQIEKKNQSDQEPAQYAVRTGLFAVDVVANLDVRLEYTRVTNWTFNQMFSRNRYLYQAEPIGDLDGNDYDRLLLNFSYWHSDLSATSASISYRRRGEGRIDADWSAPWLLIGSDYSEPFPTGLVEKKLTASLRHQQFIRRHLYLDIEAGLIRTENEQNLPGDPDSRGFFRLLISGFGLFPVGV